MTRLFLALLGGLSSASWVGVVLVENAAWSPLPMGAVGAVVAALVFGSLRAKVSPGGGAAPAIALLATLTLFPPIDTTLVSQDASLHRASGRFLARTGTIAVHEDRLASLDNEARTALFSIGSLSADRSSFSRLPGGLVIPDDEADFAYPSFSHLLGVWIAFAEALFGPDAIGWVGSAFAFLSFWAIALLASKDGWIAAVAAVALLASWLPQHFFGRFLMPEILTQALVWGGVLAASVASRKEAGAGVAALVCGLALGASMLARLEQVLVFLPALLLARAILPVDRRILPGVAWFVLGLLALQSFLHLFLIPTDYGNRVFKIFLELYTPVVYFVIWLSGNDGYIAGPILRYVVPAIFVGGLLSVGFLCRRLEVRRRGDGIRLLAALVGGVWLLLLVFATQNDGLPVLRGLGWYLPWTVWLPVVGGAGAFLSVGGLEVALLFQSIDQVVAGRVSPEQIWASRRLVPVVLPMLALMAAGALGSRNKAVVWISRLAIVVSLLLAVSSLRTVAGQPLQRGGGALAAAIAREVPPEALLVIPRELDWTHVAASVWLGDGGPATLVLRDGVVPGHDAAVAALLDGETVYVLAGEIGPAPVRGAGTGIPDFFRDWQLTEVASLPLEQMMLEPAFGRPPEKLVLIEGNLVLYEAARVPVQKSLPHGEPVAAVPPGRF